MSLQVPTLAYVSECEPEVQTVYESLICNEFLEVRREASVHRPDQQETAHLSCILGTSQGASLPEDGTRSGILMSTIVAMLSMTAPALHQLGPRAQGNVYAF